MVVHFGVGSSSVFLAQMQPQLTLVPEMQAAGVALWEDIRVRSPTHNHLLGVERGRTVQLSAEEIIFSPHVLLNSQGEAKKIGVPLFSKGFSIVWFLFRSIASSPGLYLLYLAIPLRIPAPYSQSYLRLRPLRTRTLSGHHPFRRALVTARPAPPSRSPAPR